MCLNNLSKVALDSAASKTEPATSIRKSSTLTATPLNRTVVQNNKAILSYLCRPFMSITISWQWTGDEPASGVGGGNFGPGSEGGVVIAPRLSLNLGSRLQPATNNHTHHPLKRTLILRRQRSRHSSLVDWTPAMWSTGWRCGSIVRTLVFGWLTFPDVCLIYGWHVTTLWKKCPLRVNQPGQLSLPSLLGQ